MFMSMLLAASVQWKGGGPPGVLGSINGVALIMVNFLYAFIVSLIDCP